MVGALQEYVEDGLLDQGRQRQAKIYATDRLAYGVMASSIRRDGMAFRVRSLANRHIHAALAG